MPKISLKQLAAEVATLLGEPQNEDRGFETPFPSIEQRVAILAAALLADLIKEEADSSGFIEVPASKHSRLLEALISSFKT